MTTISSDFAAQFIHLLKNNDTFRTDVQHILGIRVVPSAESYRLPPGGVDSSTCVGRILKGGEDKRWKPVVYRESQCGKPVTENGLCKTCASRCVKFDGKAGAWNGRVTEAPLDIVHMLGTAWAAKKKPVFIGTVDVDPEKEAKKEAKKAAAKTKKEAKEKAE